MNSLAKSLRRAAARALPPGAFLRRDRGEALFVSDAPRLRPGADWGEVLAGTGLRWEVRGALLRLSPGPSWLARLEAAFPDPPDALCASLARFRSLLPEDESLRLFALGARALDAGRADPRFDRLLRQRAAVCLRLNRTNPIPIPRGGGLYACALLDIIIRGGQSHETEMAGTFLL